MHSLVIEAHQHHQTSYSVEEESSDDNSDHHVYTHQLLAIPAATDNPAHEKHCVDDEQQLREGENAVHASRNVAVGVHDDRLARDSDIACVGIAQANHHPVLSLLRDVEVDANSTILTTTSERNIQPILEFN